ncbi:MAG: SAM-dependent methyltransferase, partial [Bacteroidota bacterium]
MRIESPQQDPMGQCMLAYLKGNLEAAVTVHAENGVHEAIPAAYLLRSLSDMPEWEQQALQYCTGSVLDIG